MLMRRLMLILCTLALLRVGELWAADLSSSVVRVVASFEGAERAVSTGFFFSVDGQVGIVTTLHGVVGAHKIVAANESRGEVELRLARIDLGKDLAFLAVDRKEVDSQTLLAADWSEKAVSRVVGYPQGITTQLSHPLGLHEIPRTQLRALLPPRLLAQLRRRNSPDPEIEVLSVRGRLQHGYSGAPILNVDGRVVAVGSGGLADGFADINWAIPLSSARWANIAEVASELRRLSTEGVDRAFQIFEQLPDGAVQPRLAFLATTMEGRLPEVALPICDMNTPPPGYRYIAPMVPMTTPDKGYNLRPGLFGPDGPMDFGGGNKIDRPWGFSVELRPGAGKVFGQCANWGDPSGISATTSETVPILELIGYSDQETREVQAQVILYGWFKRPPEPPANAPLTAILDYQPLGDSLWRIVRTHEGEPEDSTYSMKLLGAIPPFSKVRFRVFVPPAAVIQDHVTITDARLINARAHRLFVRLGNATAPRP